MGRLFVTFVKLLSCPSRSLMGRDLVVGWAFHQVAARPARRARKLNSRTDYHRPQGLQQLPLGVWFADCNLSVRVATSRQLNVCWSPAAPLWDPGQRCCPGFGHWFIPLAWRVSSARRGIPDSHVAVSRCDDLFRLTFLRPSTTAQRQEPRGDQTTTTRPMSLGAGDAGKHKWALSW